MYNNVPCVGHSHPHVVDAIKYQVELLNVHSRYLHEDILAYAERLVNTHHPEIANVVFSCTGTEANEVALMMARGFTGGEGIICTDSAYHGNSFLVRQLSRPKKNLLVRSFPFPDSYRCEAPNPTEFYLQELCRVIESFQKDDIPISALLICSLCANEGLPNIPEGLMRQATDIVHEAGGLVIADEVQAGLGRAGRWWGYQYSDFQPDIVTMGKPLGAGIPLAATAASREIVERFRRKSRYFNTFAASPIQAAAGNAVLAVIENEGLLVNSSTVGDYFFKRLSELTDGHPHVGDIRQKGLFLAIDWVIDTASKEPDRDSAVLLVNALVDYGFLIGNAGAFGNVLKIRPPLVFTRHHADAFLDSFKSVLNDFN